MRRLGIEFLSVLGMPPIEFVNLAADLGCSCISIGLSGGGLNPQNYPPFSLREDGALRREMRAAMRDRGVAISLGEGCNIRAGQDIAGAAADMDTFRELGAERLNTVSLDPDLGRSLDQLATFVEMVTAREMIPTIELCPVLVINNLERALEAVRHVGNNRLRLLLDTLHLGRSGASAKDITALDSALIGYLQFCDGTLLPSPAGYMVDASTERQVPGEGELALLDYLRAVPADVTISLEVPRYSLAKAGVSAEDRIRPCIEATRRMLAGVAAQ
jgi:sugar phosphate isomerase/epimerase